MTTEKYPKPQLAIQILTFIIAGTSLAFSVYVYNENQQLQFSMRRADISVLVDKASYSITKDNVNLTIRGTIINEGSRTTMIREISVGLIFNLEEATSIQVVYTYSGDIYAFFSWNNSLFLEKQTRNLFVSFSTSNDYNLTSPYKGFITIKHDDGINIQEQTFSLDINNG